MAELSLSDNTQDTRQIFNAQAEYSIQIVNYKGVQFEIDDSSFLTLNVYESLFDNSVKGDITLLDSAGFEERIPFIGQERLILKFNSSRLTRTDYSGEYVIYKMSEKIIKDRQQIYMLSFISEEYVANLRNKVSKSYKGITSSSIVSDVYSNYIANDVQNPKRLLYDQKGNSDGTFFNKHFVFPTIRPFQAINMVAKTAVASNVQLNGQSPIANFGSFLFFENKYGYWFKSIADLLDPLKTEEGAEVVKSNVEAKDEKGLDSGALNESDRGKNVKGIGKAPTSVSQKTPVVSYFILPQNAKGYTFSSGDTIINTYKFVSTFDVLSNLSAGMYGSRLLTYDPITQMIGTREFNKPTSPNPDEQKILKGNKKVDYYEFDYRREFSNFRHIAGQAYPLASLQHVGLGKSEAFYKYQTTDFEHNDMLSVATLKNVMTDNDPRFATFDKQVERHLLAYYAQRKMLNNIIIHVRVNGDQNRTIGEVVEVKLPSYYYEGEEHAYYRGNYLISKIRHNISSDGLFTTEMELIRDSLFTGLQDDVEDNELIAELGDELPIGKSGSRIAYDSNGNPIRVVGGL